MDKNLEMSSVVRDALRFRFMKHWCDNLLIRYTRDFLDTPALLDDAMRWEELCGQDGVLAWYYQQTGTKPLSLDIRARVEKALLMVTSANRLPMPKEPP